MAILVTAILPYRTGLGGDQAVNTFVIGGVSSSTPAGTIEDIVDRIGDFYDRGIALNGAKVGDYISPIVDRGADKCLLKAYDISGALDGSPHGSPFYVDTFTMPASAVATAVPDEVAVCLQVEASGRAQQLVERADGSDAGIARDRPKQRYTGRIYVGPFNTNAVTTSGTTGQTRVAQALQTTLTESYKEMADYINSTYPSAFVGVWSRKDAAVREVASVSVDDAFDTQRRRGLRPTGKMSKAIALGTPQVELAA